MRDFIWGFAICKDEGDLLCCQRLRLVSDPNRLMYIRGSQVLSCPERFVLYRMAYSNIVTSVFL